MENRNEQNTWNFLYMIFYMLVFIVMLFWLQKVNGDLPRRIPTFDLILILLATFRLIRLFVYDKVTRWLRDAFDGYTSGPFKTMYDLLNCPWCLGLWIGTVVVFFYFLIPGIVWLPILVLAIAGVASVLQLTANLIGWGAEQRKMICVQMERERGDQ